MKETGALGMPSTSKGDRKSQKKRRQGLREDQDAFLFATVAGGGGLARESKRGMSEKCTNPQPCKLTLDQFIPPPLGFRGLRGS